MNNKTVTPYCGVRAKRLYEELTFALSRTDSAALRKWGVHSSARLIKLGGLRIKSLSKFVASLGKVTVEL